MKKLLLASALFCSAISFAQITVSPAGSPSQIATILSGNGVVISNVSIYGQPNQYGYFTSVNTPLGMTGGFIMTTGDTSNVPGPSTPNAGWCIGSSYTDSSIIGVEPTATNDVCMLELDCVASDDTLFFNYVFGSEEYPEFVNSQFNDAFGIFVTGGIYNDTNMALLPNGTPVSITNINNGFQNSGPCMNCAYYVNNNYWLTPFDYDGMTTNLLAILPVVPNQTYHIKIIVADASDCSYDSGVFLQAGSFRVSNPQTVRENSDLSTVSAFPVPASANLNFQFSTLMTENLDVVFYSLDGKAVLAHNSQAVNNVVSIDVSSLAEGMYIAEIIHDGVRETKRIVISE